MLAQQQKSQLLYCAFDTSINIEDILPAHGLSTPASLCRCMC